MWPLVDATLDLLALLVQIIGIKVQILTQTALLGLSAGVAPSRCHARFTCFTSTAVHILTQTLGEQEYLQVWQLVDVTLDLLALLVQPYTY